MSVFSVLFESPLNTGITVIVLFIAVKYLLNIFNNSGSKHASASAPKFVLPPPLEKHDMTLDELKQYDGKREDKRICIAVKGNIYDCTKGYARFFGPEGSYPSLAGRDATRALATMDLTAVRDDYDDVSDLNKEEIESVNEWIEQFNERYEFVGHLK